MNRRSLIRLLILVSVGGLIAMVVVLMRTSSELPTANEESVSESPDLTQSTRPNSLDTPALVEKKNTLLQMSREEALEWILPELERGGDYETGSDLGVGGDQNVATWPSYRVYLLDMLYLIDPILAAEKSRELIEKSQSPDEWAVALRNVAKADSQGGSTEWLQSKAAELLRNRIWRADPSAGYLNAFDVIVYTQHTALSPELLALCDDLDQKAVRHASFLALDRLVQDNPDDLLPLLAKSAEQFPKCGLMISNLMARSDVRDSVQRDSLADYLLSPGRTEEELNAFAGIFPNANFHISNNLLTESQGIDGSELREHDRAALETVEEWLVDPRFERVHPTLERSRSRLKEFLGK